jgi:hypothetical protein
LSFPGVKLQKRVSLEKNAQLSAAAAEEKLVRIFKGMVYVASKPQFYRFCPCAT